MKRALAAAVLGSVLWGCTPQTGGPPPASPVDPARLRQELTALPGARIGEGNPPTLSYPGEVLFAEGSAIPLAGGTALLDPLASFLAAQPQMRWRATVRARTAEGAEHGRVLAEKRGEMLMRYMSARGVPRERIDLITEGGGGAPLELTPLQSARDASSSRSKP